MRVKVSPKLSSIEENFELSKSSPLSCRKWEKILIGGLHQRSKGKWIKKRKQRELDENYRKITKFENLRVDTSLDESSKWFRTKQPLTWSTLEFCNETAMHGLKYIVQSERHFIERIFWLTSFCVGLGLAIWLISDVLRKFHESPIIVSFWPIETSVSEIPFPAITVCNMNRILRTKADAYMRVANSSSKKSSQLESPEVMEALKNIYYLNHVCSSAKSFSQTFNYSLHQGIGAIDPNLINKIKDFQIKSDEDLIHKFFRQSSQTCKNMIPLCVWRDNIKNCSTLFRHIETDFGKCCTFNMVPQLLLTTFNNHHPSQKSKDSAAEWSSTGSKFDIEDLIPKTNEQKEKVSQFRLPRRAVSAGKTYGLSFLLRPNLPEYFCSSSNSIGFRIAAHLTTSMPHLIDFGTVIEPNSEVFIRLTADITLGGDDIQGLSLEKRKCYLKGEFTLKFYRYYTRTNCLDECITNITFDNCNCVRYYMTNDGTRELCGPQKFACAENVRNKILNSRGAQFCFQCRPTCTEISYTTTTTFTPLQSSDVLWEGPSGENLSMNENASIVHIFFGDQNFYPKIRKELYGFTDLTANIGGLLGLCLGFSALSAVELFYFLTIRPWFKPRRRRNIMKHVLNFWQKVRKQQ